MCIYIYIFIYVCIYIYLDLPELGVDFFAQILNDIGLAVNAQRFVFRIQGKLVCRRYIKVCVNIKIEN